MNVDINTITDRLSQINEQVARAHQAVHADASSSPALKAVVGEFKTQSERVLADIDEAVEAPIREHIVELEQAGDSAKAAAIADPAINAETRQTVLIAHETISALKAETKE